MPHRDLLAEQPFITGDSWQEVENTVRHARHRQRIRLMRPVTTTRNDSLPLARQLDRNKRADGVLKLEQRRQVDIGNAVLARHLTDIYAAPAVPNPDTSRRIPRRQRDEEEVQRALQNARLAKRIASQGSVLANRVNWHQHSQEHDQHLKRLQRTREFGVDRDLMKLMDPAHPLVKSKRSSAKQPQDPSTSSSSSSSSSACSSGAATARSRSGTDPAALQPPAQPRQSRSRPRHVPAPPASSSSVSSTLERLRRVDSRADAKEDADAAAAQVAEDLYVQSIMRPSHPVPPTPPSVGRSLLPSPNPRLARRSFPLPDTLDDDDSPFPSPGAASVPGPTTFPLAPKRTLRQHPPLPRGNPLFGVPLE